MGLDEACVEMCKEKRGGPRTVLEHFNISEAREREN